MPLQTNVSPESTSYRHRRPRSRRHRRRYSSCSAVAPALALRLTWTTAFFSTCAKSRIFCGVRYAFQVMPVTVSKFSPFGCALAAHRSRKRSIGGHRQRPIELAVRAPGRLPDTDRVGVAHADDDERELPVVQVRHRPKGELRLRALADVERVVEHREALQDPAGAHRDRERSDPEHEQQLLLHPIPPQSHPWDPRRVPEGASCHRASRRCKHERRAVRPASRISARSVSAQCM